VTDARAVASVACLLGDESRAAMCLAMLDGGAWTVSELAEAASVGRAAASEHVARLVAGGLVTTETQGRHKFVRLAGPRVAELVELLSGFGTPAPARSLAAVRERTRLAAARTCYDHLAGRLGVAVHDALVGRRMLTHRGGLGLTSRGRDWFADLGVDLAGLEAQRRALLRECVDLTERTPHLAGRLGVAVHDALVARRLLTHRGGLGLTPRGRDWFADLGVDLAGLEAQRRALLRECVDLTERTPHLAGSLGAALCAEFLARDWVRRRDRTRTLEVTALGERAVADLLGVAPADLAVG